jgi:serine/threonine protein kinase
MMDRENLKHYRILEKIAEGGMGTVFLAQDTILDRKVAVKVLPREAASDQERMRRFVQEAKAASALKHPNVAGIHELGEEDGLHFIVMEYVEGETLATRIERGKIDFNTVVDLSLQIADALEEAHERGIIHRDIKPSNIMITPRNHAKVLDFGLAKMSPLPSEAIPNAEARTESGMILGTVQYMSPEQVLGKNVDHRSDIFSLGAVLYEMASRQLPFRGGTWTEMMNQILNFPPPPIRRFNGEIPEELEQIILKCLEKDRDQRYQTVGELLQDLRQFKRESGELSAKTRPTPRPPSPSIVRNVMIAVLLIGIAAAAFWFYRSHGAGPTVSSIAVLPL